LLLGAEITLSEDFRKDALLFSESQSRIILSLDEKDLLELEKTAKEHKVDFTVLGKVGGTNLKINDWIDLPVQKLKEKFYNSIPGIMEKRF
jgi:phosphoribosylformylglycinamidine synthase